MKKILYLIPLLLLTACGNKEYTITEKVYLYHPGTEHANGYCRFTAKKTDQSVFELEFIDSCHKYAIGGRYND
jgi:hypothetical protein